MATRETEPADAGTADPGEASTRDRLLAFPWPAGVVTGAGAFAAEYLVFLGYVLAGIAELPGTLTDQLTRVGFVLYNAHSVVIVGETGPGNVARPYTLLEVAVEPLVYLAVPVVVLLIAAGGFTHWRRPDSRDALPVVATGAAMALGYLAVALVGTYAFTLVQISEGARVLWHPDRPATLLFFAAYPFVLGVVGTVAVQAWQAGE